MRDQILELQTKIREGFIGTSVPWRGADVVILEKAPKPNRSRSFYPDPRFVETKFVTELSWVFRHLQEIFSYSDGFGQWKEEFFGRLGNVATRFQSVCPECKLEALLEVVVEEAAIMADEIIKQGGLRYLSLTFDNRILDDFELVSDTNKYLSQKEVQELRDLYLGDWVIEVDHSKKDKQE